MAKLMLQDYNLLALDEPTNHMDIKSKDILKQALKAYDGTLIVVSHDRDFLEGLVDKMYEFRSGHVYEVLGTVSDFLAKRKLESLQELERNIQKAPTEVKLEVTSSKTYAQSKEQSKADRKTKNRIAWLEGEIAKCEKRQAEIEKILSAPSQNDDIMELTREYLECKRSIDSLTEEWGTLI